MHVSQRPCLACSYIFLVHLRVAIYEQIGSLKEACLKINFFVCYGEGLYLDGWSLWVDALQHTTQDILYRNESLNGGIYIQLALTINMYLK